MAKKFHIPTPYNPMHRNALLQKRYAMIEDAKKLDFDALIADLQGQITDLQSQNEDLDPTQSEAIQGKIQAIQASLPLIKVMLEQNTCYGEDRQNGITALIGDRSGQWNLLTNKWSGDVVKLNINFPAFGSVTVEVKIAEFK